MPVTTTDPARATATDLRAGLATVAHARDLLPGAAAAIRP